ncbi:MAG: hypothetical protein K9L62_00345 [Vallitaleaceae bacterium]|nr:hypothetical protein [Vallitaleaceae bacterium]
MAKDKAQDNIVRVAAEVASKTAIEVYTKQKEKEKRMRSDRRLRDTKRLMRNYREIKVHAGDAIASLAEIETEDFDFFQSLMEDMNEIDVKAIIQSKAKSAIMLTHIDTMLQAYQTICYGSKKPEEQRRYRVLESMRLVDDPPSVSEIAERENIDTRTVYKDLDAACEKMSALLFGIQWIERE